MQRARGGGTRVNVCTRGVLYDASGAFNPPLGDASFWAAFSRYVPRSDLIAASAQVARQGTSVHECMHACGHLCVYVYVHL